MTLTVGALTFRSASRTQSASLSREQQVIDNVAAPAVDRAKAKLEYLFGRDTRMPGTSTPSSDILSTLMLNITSVGADGLGITKVPSIDPYTLPDEVRLDINGDDKVDNAWSFAFDIDGDGKTSGDEIVAYSILMDDSVDPAAVDNDDSTVPTATRDDDIKLEDTGEVTDSSGNKIDLTERKAQNLITRNGPLNTSDSLAGCGTVRAPAQGWLTISNAALEKNFQITAFVSNGKDLGRANSAFELQQVRLAQKGNTWGAWFKYDMEIHPGPEFNWNGAIHTDGNMLITNKLRAHMISSHNSCLYSEEASAITMAEVDNDGDSVIKVGADSEDFQGQLIEGVPGYGKLEAKHNSFFHLPDGPNKKPTTGNKLETKNDSVDGKKFSDLMDIALDPVALFTLNKSKHRNTGTWKRDPEWSKNALNAKNRVINDPIDQPFLDDFYRADNRYGPKPNYEKYNWVNDTDEGSADAVINTTRSDVKYDKQVGDEIISTDLRADKLTNASDGLDGYWERKSIANGMRVVIGQRLELGNQLGWNSVNPDGTTIDPIYPPETLDPPLRNKQLQRVTLRDNLAAVQGMVVYHYKINDGFAPLACIANTVHPGTIKTLRDSRTFDESASGVVQTNFFEGVGTNGWEFSYPATFDSADASGNLDESEFGTALGNTQPLGIALRNLAHFAGDPNGGAPSFNSSQDSNVHPFPSQAMWGDFSVLRRIFDDYLDSVTWRSSANPPQITTMGARYTALSAADKASLHSAACTTGLLAYNVDNVITDYTTALSTGSVLTNISSKMSDLLGTGPNSLEDREIPKLAWTDGNPNTVLKDADGNDILDSSGTAICPAGADTSGFQADCDTMEYYGEFGIEQWLDAYDAMPSTTDRAAIEDAIALYRSGNQILRDRTLGFRLGNPVGLATLMGTTDNVGWNAETGFNDRKVVGGNNVAVQTTCDPDIFNQIAADDVERMGMSLMLCAVADAAPVKYPSLYYLFPMVDHDHNGAVASGDAASPAFTTSHSQPSTEGYVDTVSTYGVNSSYVYSVLKDSNGDNIENNGENGYADIAFTPKASDGNDWVLPTETFPSSAPASPLSLDPGSMDIKIPNGNLVALSLLDKAMYNGREEMMVRVLDFDLQKLTRNKLGTSTPSNPSDYWISNGRNTANGLLYAAREDAAREDEIVRPAAAAWTECNTLTTVLSETCQMRPSRTTAKGGPIDPPLSRREDGSLVGISVKPVDFAPDPDRRPYGFRLKAALDGNKGDLSDRKQRLQGFTLVTDNAAYIQGEFNPHTSDGDDTIEEFKETLFNNNVKFGDQFYNNRKTVDNTFASTDSGTSGDRWRVAEVLADAVYLLSDEYVDGSVEDGFILNRAEKSSNFGSSKTSFQNQQRPIDEKGKAWGGRDDWFRIDGDRGATGGDSTLPIWVGRNGQSIIRGGSPPKNTTFDNAEVDSKFELPGERSKDGLIAATKERINATIISGIVPSRSGQGYGGLHNFPRFLENWSGKDLFIQGAFLQLNFSTAGTGPFDADAWDPGDTPIAPAEQIGYYSPPGRRWGYDVGLQFAPPGPISQRFVSVGRPRSEHYRELPVEDPYVTNLRCSRFLPDPNDENSFDSRFPDEC